MTSNDPRGRSKRHPGTLRGDPKSMVAKNMIFDELWGAKGAPKAFQMDHLGAKRLRKTIKKLLEIRCRKNFSFDAKIMPKGTNIGAKYNNKWCKQTAAKHVWKIIKKHVFAKV